MIRSFHYMLFWWKENHFRILAESAFYQVWFWAGTDACCHQLWLKTFEALDGDISVPPFLDHFAFCSWLILHFSFTLLVLRWKFWQFEFSIFCWFAILVLRSSLLIPPIQGLSFQRSCKSRVPSECENASGVFDFFLSNTLEYTHVCFLRTNDMFTWHTTGMPL